MATVDDRNSQVFKYGSDIVESRFQIVVNSKNTSMLLFRCH